MNARSIKPGLSALGRRQVEAQHVAAAVEIAAVENKHAVAIVDARARLRRRNEAAQTRAQRAPD